ncbi:MAG: phosphatase PAP2 family protein [Gemmatimonadetes bacterium]|nr:phosphatase PAP2 family protein [Gemmatimonadota bacterium]NNM34762.1 phosphatase PAP2 family protein [Gemmatimonadota bacterium]
MSPSEDGAPFNPEFRKGRELLLSGMGVGFGLTGALLPNEPRSVPTAGLNPADISLSLDRSRVGNRSVDSDQASDWTRNAAVLLPFMIGLAVTPQSHRWKNFARRTAVYGETFLLSQGLTLLLKSALGRPRPFVYLAEGVRPDDSGYDVARERAFRSMPSGHSSSAWTGAGLAMTEHWLSRPQAGNLERFGIGFAAGALAAATSSLRSSAGQHFPTDVVAGAGIGLVSGVIVPVLHRGEGRAPISRAWPHMAGGFAGVVVGIVLGG